MAIIATKPFLIIGMLKDRKQILEELQILACSQIEETESFKKINLEKKIEQIIKKRTNAKKAIKIILNYTLTKKKFGIRDKKKHKSFKSLKNIEKLKLKLSNIINSILEHEKKIKNIKTEIENTKTKILILKNYENFNIPIKNIKTKYTTTLIGEIEGNYCEQELLLKLKKVENKIYFKIMNFKQNKTIILISILNSALNQTLKILSNLTFSGLNFETTIIPKEKIIKLTEKNENLKIKVLNMKEAIKKNILFLNNIKMYVDYLTFKIEKYKAIKKTTETKNTFLLKGFINPKYEKTIKKIITKNFNSYIEIFSENENSPILFHNNFFTKPMQEITKTYSIPSNKDIDPNPVMAFFYYTFFGMMFSDAGYGLILSLTCFLILISKKFKQKENLIKLMFLCGIFTTFWGFMYGSFFGDFIKIFSKRFLNLNLTLKPLWINTTKSPLILLIFSILIGILQIVIGLLIKILNLIKSNNKKEAFFTTLNWVLILTGIGIFLFNSIIKICVLNILAKSLFILGVIITIFLSGYKKKGILKLVFGIMNLYTITSFVSDILSYSRLMALGIATGVIAEVVNILASMSKANVLGNIIFALIFTVGHAINFSINILGAYVHTNRLQYVEFFSKFYIGGGKVFNPFKVTTKYYTFSKNNAVEKIEK